MVPIDSMEDTLRYKQKMGALIVIQILFTAKLKTNEWNDRGEDSRLNTSGELSSLFKKI